MTGILDARTTDPLTGGPSFDFGNRSTRLAWSLVWRVLGIWTPRPLHGWRAFLARLFGARLARTARIYPGVRIWLPSNLEMADHATLGPGVDCYNMALIRLEAHALVSQRATLCAGTHDIDSAAFQLEAHPISIGRYGWVAAEAFVGPGVVVGEGAVLGARAVAFRNLEPWTVHVGNPARQVRNRARRGADPEP